MQINKSLSVNFLKFIGQGGTSNSYVVLSAKNKESPKRGIWIELEDFNSMYQSTNNVIYDPRKVGTEK